jgi:hypothetical protein
MTLTTRRATPEDAEAVAALINEIIRIGGTTAYETPFDRDSADHEFISGAHVVSCVLAESDGELLGFQILFGSTEDELFNPKAGSLSAPTRAWVKHEAASAARCSKRPRRPPAPRAYAPSTPPSAPTTPAA